MEYTTNKNKSSKNTKLIKLFKDVRIHDKVYKLFVDGTNNCEDSNNITLKRSTNFGGSRDASC